ncbi:MAG: nucleotidyltransferase domain-containing protein [Nitrospiraceae bacterium]
MDRRSQIPPEVNARLPRGTFLLAYRGSHAHGTYMPPTQPTGIDDVDLLGACVGPTETYLGFNRFEQSEFWQGDHDVVVYEVRKLFRLLLQANPNVLGLLWLRPDHYLYSNYWGTRLVKERDRFSSLRAYDAFVGYAHSQLKRMERCHHQGYMGAKRKALVERFGFDTKNAAHLIRLFLMGSEFVRNGVLRVDRTGIDADELIQIKTGNRSLEWVKARADDLFESMREAKERSPLPKHPDEEGAERLLMEIVRAYIDTPVRH